MHRIHRQAEQQPAHEVSRYGGIGFLIAALGDLEVVRAGPVERPVVTPDGERIAVDHVLRAVRAA